jgi:hypothetical protein
MLGEVFPDLLGMPKQYVFGMGGSWQRRPAIRKQPQCLEKFGL